MNPLSKWVAAGAAALMALSGAAQAAPKVTLPGVTLAIGGAGCLCYLPTVLAKQLGMYKKAGIDVQFANFKGGSTALRAVIGGSADVVSGYFDHAVKLAAKHQRLKSFVVYDRFPGLALVVAPDRTGKIASIESLAGKKVGVTAPGASTDFFLKYELKQAGLASDAASVIGIGVGGTAIAAMEQGEIDAAVMLDPAVTILQSRYKELKILVDTRNQEDTRKAFGGDYPGGALYAKASWIDGHAPEAQMLTTAIIGTLKWIHSHSAREIMLHMPPEIVGRNKAAYLAALKNTIPMYSEDGLMDPKGAEAVLAVFSAGDPEVADAHIDVTRTYTNEFAKRANGT